MTERAVMIRFIRSATERVLCPSRTTVILSGLVFGCLWLGGCAEDSSKTVPRPGSQVQRGAGRAFEKLKDEEQRRVKDREAKPTFQLPRGPSVVEGEILVKFKDTLLEGKSIPERMLQLNEVAKRLSQDLRVRVLSTFAMVGLQRLICDTPEHYRSVMASLESNPDVEFAEPNYRLYAFESPVLPNDPRWTDDLWGMKKIEVMNAWVRSTGSEAVTIGVIDTGIDYQHRDLAQNMWKNPGEKVNGQDDDGNGIVDDIHGANFCNGAMSGDPLDDNGHGSHVAGTVAAVGNNHLDVVGANWKAQLMAVKFLCKDGSGTTADAIQAIQYALSMGAQILNNSWGGSGFSRALEAAIKEADRRGVLFVAAAGNETNDNDKVPSYPASYTVPNVIAVGATTQEDGLASFSNWGLKSVQIAAPGVSILSTIPGDRLDSFSGTSMATPHVTGCAGLVKARNPSLQGRELKEVVLNGADKIGSLRERITDGRRLNCGNAVPF
ncbi:MAG: peptidase S8 [Nitrospirae bacterium]|nr:MAG: peptidase S8 [Nitrospirota bacterium]